MTQSPSTSSNLAAQRPGAIGVLARGSGLLTLIVAIAAVALSLARTVSVIQNTYDALEAAGGVLIWEAGWVFVWPGFGAVGAVVLWRQPHNKLGWMCLGLGFVTCLRAALVLGAGFSLGAPLRAALMYGLGGAVGEIALPALLTTLLLYFPTGRIPSPRWRPVLWIACIGSGLGMLQSFRQDTFWPYDNVAIPNPLYVEWLHAVMPAPGMRDPISAIAFYVGIAALGLAAASLFVRARAAGPAVREHTRWVIVAGVVSAGLTIAAMVIVGLDIVLHAGLESGPGAAAPVLLLAGGLLGFGTLVPLAIGAAIVRHRLWGVEVALSHAFVYAVLIAIVTLLYAALVGGMGIALQSAGDPILSLVATGMVALAAIAAHARVKRGINRLMFGDRDDPVTILARLGRKLETASNPAAALQDTVDTVMRALRVPYAAIVLEGSGLAASPAGSAPADGAGLIAVPMRSQAETEGRLIVARRAPEDALDARDMQVLEAIAQQAAGVARAARLLGELQRSRAQLVATREEERRRLRRDLHDELGPTIAAQTLALDAAMDLIEADPAAARLALGQLKAHTRDTLIHVRRIVHDLRPPALDELGLAGALRALFERPSTNGAPTVHVEAPDPAPALPAAAEAAAYRIAAEAVANCVRHAHARVCTVTIDVEPALLRLVIQDDGRGLAPNQAAGVGLRSMRERAEEMGGTLWIGTSPFGGARVEAELPI